MITIPTTDKSPQELQKMGYRIVSRKHGIISRVDRKDWLDVLAKYYAPWDPMGEGRADVISRSKMELADIYRRCHSNDKLQLDPKKALEMKDAQYFFAGYIDPETYQNTTDFDAYLKEAWRYFGEKAAEEGVDWAFNPYPAGTQANKIWNEAWTVAKDNKEEVVAQS